MSYSKRADNIGQTNKRKFYANLGGLEVKDLVDFKGDIKNLPVISDRIIITNWESLDITNNLHKILSKLHYLSVIDVMPVIITDKKQQRYWGYEIYCREAPGILIPHGSYKLLRN